MFMHIFSQPTNFLDFEGPEIKTMIRQCFLTLVLKYSIHSKIRMYIWVGFDADMISQWVLKRDTTVTTLIGNQALIRVWAMIKHTKASRNSNC